MNKIVKKLLLAAVVSLASTMVWSWSWTDYNDALEGNRFLLNAGVGYGYARAKVSYDNWWTYTGRVGGLVVPVKGEFLLQKIPLGIYLNVRPLFGRFYYDNWKAFSISIIPGVDYHVDTGVSGLDLYAGLGFGVYISSVKWEYATEKNRYNSVRFAWDTHIGVSYYFTDHLGINAEVGWPTWGSVSLAFKF